MDRLAEQVVIWHNRHPLAKRITIYDVHTIGVVALPFMRSGPAAGHGGQDHAADPRGPIEPVLTDEISPESLAAAWDDENTVAANTNAAHLDALADQELPPRKPGSSGLKGWLSRLLFWRRGPAGAAVRDAHGSQIWPAFSERFVAGLSPKAIARFAQKQGYSTQPGDATWPLRIVSMDDDLMSRGGASSGGAWPFELYLMSAAIDAGRSRSRVLVGRGGQQAQILGGRCLSGPRLAVVGLLSLSLMGFGTALLIPGLIVKKSSSHSAAADEAAIAAASAASAATSTEPSASASSAIAASAADHAVPAASDAEVPPATTSTASAPSLNAIAAPALDLAASAAAQREAMAAAAAAAEAAKSSGGKPSTAEADAEAGIDKNAPRPDIRPLIVKPIPGRSARPLLAPPGASAPGSEAAEGDKAEPNSGAQSDKTGKALKPTDKDGPAASSSKSSTKTIGTAEADKAGSKKTSPGKEPSPGETDDKNTAANVLGGAGGSNKLEGAAAARVASLAKKPVVALVGPVSANKAEAEATLERMRTLLAPTQSSRSPLQAQVFQTPEGYRPAVWPFASREEAQLINATLVARGMRTRAVDF